MLFNPLSIFGKKKYDALPSALLKEYDKHRTGGPHTSVCYAPFKSLYFGHHGRAIACCYNRTHVLGEYPKQTIKEIWHSKEANQLREAILHNDFSMGCLGCKQQLMTRNFDAVKAKQYDDRKPSHEGYPSVLEFELSNVCNLECEMCSGDFSSLIRTKREKLPPLENPYNSDFVKQLQEFIPHLEEAKFYGGEPFLIDIYYEIWEKIREINPSIRISVQTNATTLNNRVKELLQATNFHINVSIDSLQKDTYEFIRKNATFERTMENIKWFSEYCRQRGTFFGISACAMQQNWREIPDFINFCNDMEVPVYFHTVVFPSHCSIKDMKQEEIGEVLDYLSTFNFPTDTSLKAKNKFHFEGIKSQINTWYNSHALNLRAKKLQKFADLEQYLIEVINNDKSQSEDKKKVRVEKIKKKIVELDERIDADLFRKIAAGLDLNDPFVFNNVAFYLENFPYQALLLMAKANFR